MGLMNETVWIVKECGEEAQKLADALNIPLEIACILVNRNITDPFTTREFLFGTLENLHDPFLMKDMKKVVFRIQQAIREGENILIFGDYDVDGILSVVILTKALMTLGGKVDHYIPDRLNKGYGIKQEYLDIAIQRKAGLVISVDCGIKAIDFVRSAKEKNIDTIITDHHRAGKMLPDSYAILNPVIPDSSYPEKNLAGIGVVFKLIQALFERNGLTSQLPHYLKLVSIGTVADVVELRGENRLFVKYGLKGLSEVSNQGLKSLLEICRLENSKITAGDVGFRIGPRINAAGRLGDTENVFRLFFSDSVEETRDIVLFLDKMNSQRQKIEERILRQAINRIKKRNLNIKHKLLILGCDEWHRGVIGIVASKIKDYFNQPVLLFSYTGGMAFGSGRSIKEFSLINCLENCKQYFNNFGGHTLAAGCELKLENMRLFKEAVNEYTNIHLKDDDLKRKLHIDTRISFQAFDRSFLEHLNMLQPFGVGNPRPVFLTENVEIWGVPKRLKGKHSKFFLQNEGRVFEGLGWQKAELTDFFNKGDRVDIVYTLQTSTYLGQDKLSLSLEDLRRHRD
ncbi:MAG: single-stranded-DNA-specific exonuclease RecJ [Candidatus Aminicenantes bacterium]|nr:single-stranded-DNA-specific exonuclease RecJ [Candidatus Aminicenantes bacterium]